MGKLANTIFETGANAALAAIDVYNKTSKEPVNTVEIAHGKDINKVDSNHLPITGIKGPISKEVTGYTAPNLKFEQSVNDVNKILAERYPGANKVDKNNTLLGGVLKGMGYTGTIDGVVDNKGTGVNLFNRGDLINIKHDKQVGILSNGIKHFRENIGKTQNVTDVAKFFSNLYGNDELMKVIGLPQEAKLIKSALDLAIKLRLPEAVDKLIDKIDNDDVKQELIINTVESAARNSDIEHIWKIVNHPQGGVGRILAMYPDIIKLILSNFTFSEHFRTHEIKKYTRMIDLIYKLNPKWLVYERSGKEIGDITQLDGISEDAITVMLHDERTQVVASLGDTYTNLEMVDDTLDRRKYTPSFLAKTARDKELIEAMAKVNGHDRTDRAYTVKVNNRQLLSAINNNMVTRKVEPLFTA